MKTTELTQQQKRKRRLLLIAPLLILPFVILFFWAMGGGSNAQAKNALNQIKGFNSVLPGAKLKDQSALDKMSYYNQAAKDSDKIRELQKEDPYGKSAQRADTASLHFPIASGGLAPLNNRTSVSASEAQVYQKLAQLQQAINRPPQEPVPVKSPLAVSAANPISKPASTTTSDPELQQMNGLLEKILDIQHPERVKDKKEITNTIPNKTFQATPAIVDGNQKIVQGTVIRMKLQDSVHLNGQLFPKGQLIYGSGDLNNQRCKINIKLIHVGLQIIPVNLSVYDRTDGMEGISVPEAVTGDAVKDGAVSGIQDLDMMSYDPSVGAQMATAGINTAKGLFAKKVKRVKGKLKNGHELLLRDNEELKKVH